MEPETGVRRFALRPVTGIDPAAVSPWWLQRRLLLCGIRAISPAVDVTNYVMLELGHPMHAHDRKRITGGFAVRFARAGRDGRHPRRHRAPARSGRRADRRRCGDRGDRRRDGCGQHRGARRLHRRAAGGGGMGPGRGLAHRSAGCICPARPPVATNATSTRPSRWPRWTAAPRCSPRSPAARSRRR